MYQIYLEAFDAVELALLGRMIGGKIGSAAYALLVANVGNHKAKLLDSAALDAIDAMRRYDASLEG